MLHLGKNTTSIIKGIAAGGRITPIAVSSPPIAPKARNFTNCELALITQMRRPYGAPTSRPKPVGRVRAKQPRKSREMLFYAGSADSAEEATALVVNGFVKDVLQQLPMEFAVEARS